MNLLLHAMTWMALVLLASSALAAPAPLLRVDASSLDCAQRAKIEAGIAQRLAAAIPADGAYRLRVEPYAPAGLRIALARPSGVDYQRVIPFHAGDCAAVEDLVVAIAQRWLQQPWRALARAAVEAAPPVGPPPAAMVPESRAGGWWLSAAAGAYATFKEDQLGPTLAVGVDWSGSGRWGLTLQAGLDGPVSQTSGRGTTRVSVAHLEAGLRLSVLRLGTGVLDVVAGPALHLLSARSSGYRDTAARRTTDAAVATALRWTQPVVSRLTISLALGLSARAHNDVFRIENLGPVLTVPALRSGALVGIGYRVD